MANCELVMCDGCLDQDCWSDWTSSGSVQSLVFFPFDRLDLKTLVVRPCLHGRSTYICEHPVLYNQCFICEQTSLPTESTTTHGCTFAMVVFVIFILIFLFFFHFLLDLLLVSQQQTLPYSYPHFSHHKLHLCTILDNYLFL